MKLIISTLGLMTAIAVVLFNAQKRVEFEKMKDRIDYENYVRNTPDLSGSGTILDPQRRDCKENRGGIPKEIYSVNITEDLDFRTTNIARDEEGCIHADIGTDKGLKHCGPTWLIQKTGMFYCDTSYQ